ncbi:hypothetical protein MMC22_002542 [Lobaria immixta]|nr:hypothetical protein [Lobaria immixta]
MRHPLRAAFDVSLVNPVMQMRYRIKRTRLDEATKAKKTVDSQESRADNHRKMLWEMTTSTTEMSLENLVTRIQISVLPTLKATVEQSELVQGLERSMMFGQTAEL